MYANGQGVPKDYVVAHKWFNLAASRFTWAEEAGYRDNATKDRDLIAANMTPAQIAEAQKRARDWKPKSTSVQQNAGSLELGGKVLDSLRVDPQPPGGRQQNHQDIVSALPPPVSRSMHKPIPASCLTCRFSSSKCHIARPMTWEPR